MVTEPGGPTAQAGIFYQNTVAARAMLDLLDLGRLPQHERVTEVRIEAPGRVDDVVVGYGDRHRDWIQAKVALEHHGEAWHRLWENLAKQRRAAAFKAEDRLRLVLGEAEDRHRALRDLCERARAIDIEELRTRLSKPQARVLATIEPLVPAAELLDLLRTLDVEIATLSELEDAYRRRRLATAAPPAASLLSDLRSIAGGEARHRALFQAAPLRTQLVREGRADITEPQEWGLAAYRDALIREARIEIPGTGVSGASADLFVWPRARDYDRRAVPELEDGDDSWAAAAEAAEVDLATFPAEGLDRAVVIAPAGHGKSALLRAAAAQLANSPYVPALIPLSSLASSGRNVLEYLLEETNREYTVRIDWARLAEQGLAILLFDGLDEVPAAARQSLLGDIARFSARHPNVPWLLTVRDPAVLSGPADGRMVELAPLEASDIIRFVDTLGKRLSANLDGWAFYRNLEAYPDIRRLARIPLFLSLLIANAATGGDLPSGRADLIEGYLKTLFSPHAHKAAIAVGPTAPTVLRRVAEALAFDRLERQEIGATEAEVFAIAERHAGSDGDAVVARLLANGVVRRQSAIRLQFPFPIVQEYLAACHLVREHSDSLERRVEDAIQRPWAQVIQFALEQLTDPTPVVQAMLSRSDDAFSTGLRLLARCVVNGARVSDDLRETIGRRLVDVWRCGTLRTREQAGRLVLDGFTRPAPPYVREALRYSQLNNSGGEIVVREADPALSARVLRHILTERLGRYTSVRPMQPAIDVLGDAALDAYIAAARNPEVTADQLHGLTSLVAALSANAVSTEKALALALDEDMPDRLRLAAFLLTGVPLDSRAGPVIERSLTAKGTDSWWPAADALARSAEPEDALRALLRRPDIAAKRRRSLVHTLPTFCKDIDRRLPFVVAFADDHRLPPSYREVAAVFAACFGSRQHMDLLVGSLGRVRPSVAQAVVSNLGHHHDRALGELAAESVRQRVSDMRDAAMFASAASTGMRYRFDMFSFQTGTLNPAPLHPSISAWRDLVGSWLDLPQGSASDRLRLLIAAQNLGVDKSLDEIEAVVLELDPNARKWDKDDDYGHLMTSALRTLRDAQRLLPVEIGLRFARSRRPNAPRAGIQAIAAHGDRAALEQLVALHGELSGWYDRDSVIDAAEILSGRLGIVVELDAEGGLQIPSLTP